MPFRIDTRLCVKPRAAADADANATAADEPVRRRSGNRRARAPRYQVDEAPPAAASGSIALSFAVVRRKRGGMDQG